MNDFSAVVNHAVLQPFSECPVFDAKAPNSYWPLSHLLPSSPRSPCSAGTSGSSIVKKLLAPPVQLDKLKENNRYQSRIMSS